MAKDSLVADLAKKINFEKEGWFCIQYVYFLGVP